MSLRVTKHGEIISRDTLNIISTRYHTVTRSINREFWNSQSETLNSIYVGSYGRGTAIDTSDIDILVELPQYDYGHYNAMNGNKQSRLLQAIRNSILSVYPRSDVRADGQVVKILFNDGLMFEVLPAFKNIDWNNQWDGTYKYPDTNMGGKWQSTNPKAEQIAMKQKNDNSNGLLFDTCKHLRRIRDAYFSSYHLSGIVIDSFVYSAMGNWKWLSVGETTTAKWYDYENALLDYLKKEKRSHNCFSITAPGSYDYVETSTSINCLEKVLMLIACP